MKYYVWVDRQDRPILPAWAYKDESERLAEESRPPEGAMTLRTGTKEELKARYGLKEGDFVGAGEAPVPRQAG